MPRRRVLVLKLSIAQLDMLQVAQLNYAPLGALGGISLGLNTSVDLATLDTLEKLAYSRSPQKTREFITQQALLDKIQRLRRVAEAEEAERIADFEHKLMAERSNRHA